MSIDTHSLRQKLHSASAGEWIKDSGDGWEAICSANDQANGNFIIAHFEGPDAQANREFMQAANPDTVLALLDALEAAEKRIAELEKGHCGAPLLEREEAHVKTVSGLLAELGKWQQESSTWQSVAEKQLAIAIEAEKRIAELTAPDGNAIAWESTTPVYIKFITDERYQKLRPGYQKWYKPYCCSNCAAGISVKGE